MNDLGLGLTPIDDRDRAWLDAACVSLPASCCASGEIPASYHPPLTTKNQGRTNTCAGHAFSTGREQLNFERTGTVEIYSALAAYLFAKREYDGTANDNGTSISSLFDAAAKCGTPRESSCPFQGSVNPRALTSAAIAEAGEHRIGQFVRLKGYDAVWRFKTASLGFVVFGGPWYDGMTVQSLGTQRETLDSWRGRLLGFHARVLTGWFSPQEMTAYCRNFDPARPDLEVWNSHGDGPRPISAEVIDQMSNDPRCEMIGCMDQTEFAPQRAVDWRTTECLL